MNETLQELKGLILDLKNLSIDSKEQQNKHNKRIEDKQSEILSNENTYKNKNIVIYILLGMLVGMILTYNRDLVIEWLNPIAEILRAIFKIGN